MTSLALSILASSLIFIIFKLYTRFKVDTLFAIVTNYFVACGVGLTRYHGETNLSEIPQKPWFLGTFILGILFIAVFNLMAAASQKVGVSVTSVATKMSFVLPVIFGILVYGEELGPLKVGGIVLALAAVYFTSIKEPVRKFKKTALLLPALVFLGSGIIDTSLKYIQEVHIKEEDYPLFSATVFGSAACIGLLVTIYKMADLRSKFNLNTLLGGISLGVVNYFSIFFLLKALQNDTLNSASIFTINNVAIVMFTTLLGIILFKEKISPKNWSGIALAITSIILVAFG
ncbi:DMT family transporter [Zobellia uliginosa]|uniref:DMT family transporter n=1 Tax=Zobellia uliginosa TaxID=143224 RepID=UPI0026E3B94E|nr:DMT family transporter [Zobellia uliginosa]MDO6517081.1 DMT family transporter [Zobellia uliginosa]